MARGTPEDWTKEAEEMGVSRRLSQIPKDLVVGETWAKKPEDAMSELWLRATSTSCRSSSRRGRPNRARSLCTASAAKTSA